MVLQIYFPQSPQLKPFIECFWYIDEQIGYGQERILPTATIELIINFGDVFHVREHEDSKNYQVNKDAWLVGIHNRAIVSEITGYSHMIGVRFRPYGAFPFFRIHASEIHNQIIEMDLILGRDIAFLREQLFCTRSTIEKFQLLEGFLLSCLTQSDDNLAVIRHAVRAIEYCGGDLSIKALAGDIGISQKHLGNQFKKIVGVTPRHLGRIYRFQTVLQSIQPQRAIDWSEIAYLSNYYDQSHFNKDFMQFTGLTPTQYVGLLQPYLPDNDDNRHFVPTG